MIRRATSDDWPSISNISRRSGYEDYINRVGNAYLDHGEVLVYDEGRIKGFAKVEYLPDGSVWFSGLRVDPEYWRSGIGLKITEASLEMAKKRDCPYARLLVYDDNMRSLNLVEKIGFNQVEKYTFLHGLPDLSTFLQEDSAIENGMINIGWKFVDASKVPSIKGTRYSRDKWEILETNDTTFEILRTGNSRIYLDGEGFTCAKNSITLENCVENYKDLEVSSGYVLEKRLS